MKSSQSANIFRPLPFYHPKSDNTGLALSFSYNSSEDKLYLNILKQTGWDQTAQRGTFGGEDKKVVKFSQIEAAAIAKTIQDRLRFGTIHKFNGITNTFSIFPLNDSFALDIKHETENTGVTFSTNLSTGESYLLKSYIDAAIQESFYRMD